MNKELLVTFTLLIGLSLNSCTNKSAENRQSGSEETEIIVSDYATQSIDDDLADKIKNYINNQFLTEADLRAISDDEKKFQLYKVDLNNDGSMEVFVNFITPYFCGSGGCTVLLLNNNLELITRFSPTKTLFVGEQMENNWKVLITRVDADWKKLVYENGSYPSNPTMVELGMDLPENAKKIFDEDHSKQKTYLF